MEQKKRYELIDGIRGLAMVNMVIFHFLYDVFIIYGRDPGWYGRTGSHLWQQGICWTFILVSGFSWRFGKKNSIRRGIFLNLCGLVITVVTGLAVPGQAAIFGILNFLGCAILLMALLDRWADRIPPAAGLVGSMLCFFLLRHINTGTLGIGALSVSIPRIGTAHGAGIPRPGIFIQRLFFAASLVFSVCSRIFPLSAADEIRTDPGDPFCQDPPVVCLGKIQHLGVSGTSAAVHGDLYAFDGRVLTWGFGSQ